MKVRTNPSHRREGSFQPQYLIASAFIILIIPQESDTGLAPPHLWDIAADRQRMQEEQPLQVARCTKIIQDEKDPEKSKYVINVKQIAKFVVNLGDRVSPTDIEEGMRVGYVSVSATSIFHFMGEHN